MISAFANTWKVPELRARIVFTLAIIIFIRLGVHITLPGVDASVIKEWMDNFRGNDPKSTGGVTAMLQVFSGGGLTHAGVFALGIMPYISASIMVQLMTAVVPKLSRLAREDGGREKITQYTRYITIGIALVQGYFVAKTLSSTGKIMYMPGIENIGRPLVPDPSVQWYCLTILTIVAGTMFLMWLGDQITDKGVGNGTSIIITVNIIAGLPGALIGAWNYFVQPENPFMAFVMVGLIILMLLVIAGTIAITEAQRRIAVQYAKRIVGRKQFGGQTQYLPLKVNYAGVMPVIFASAILSIIPTTLGLIPKLSDEPWVMSLIHQMNGGTAFYVLGGVGIFLFSYFWVAMMFQPSQISEDLKRNGGYIPGVRPGKPTADFLDFTMSRLTFAGALFLAILFALPVITGKVVGLPAGSPILNFFGGTSLLIMVGVILDMMRQIETHLLQKHYDGFLRKGKLKGRYDRAGNNLHADIASKNSLVLLWTVIAILVVAGITIYFYNQSHH
ncbi:preprotein translocase subunit SecY [Luteolibacter pohnpeiensis]|uniref:Protein translocase subunit SecY n=1 Tax=Luteolibacter pohnpeiensis TaxID=454153 RepID=A0A934S7Q2_9BACT|nr:preprotein translocase subunit SecY [Luteolibacter pohnpeiensis]MBK1882840.1 preprotein translocase subunit SecY [Luteolibacter pohnpeiensis]